jgi:hypothetical protein
MSLKKFIPDSTVDYINRLARLGMLYDSSPPMSRIVGVRTGNVGLIVTRDDGKTRLAGCNDYFIVELRRLKRDERREVEFALNALADVHMLYVGAGFKREVYIVTFLTKDFAYIISRDEDGAYRQVMSLSCLNYLFVKIVPRGC